MSFSLLKRSRPQSMCFAILSNQSDRVPSPHQAFEKAKQYNMADEIIKISGISLNMALEAAANEPQHKIGYLVRKTGSKQKLA